MSDDSAPSAAPVRLQGPPDPQDHVHEYLLHEFDHLAESLLQNEESGEKRVQFFIAVLTAVLAVLGLIFKGEQESFSIAAPGVRLTIAVCLVVLFVFGLSTLVRLVERNKASDRYKFALRAIRRRFVSAELALAHPTAFFDPYTKMKQRSALPVKGGWLDVIVLLNGLIVGALTWVLSGGAIEATSILATLAVFLVVIGWQFIAVERQYRAEWEKLVKLDGLPDTIAERPG